MRSHRPALLLLTLLAPLACADDVAPGAPPPRPPVEDVAPDLPDDPDAEVEEEEVAEPEVVEDTPPDLPEDTPDDPPLRIDAFFEDAFMRPDAPEDVPPDEPDAPPSGPRVAGDQGCLFWELTLNTDRFVFGQDMILITWDVRNHCSRPYRIRVEHRGDLLPIVILKDGAPWLAYPDCFGRGDIYETVFDFANGLRQGWLWLGADHQTWIDRCAASPFDPASTYEVVGYGASEVAATDLDLSEVAPLSTPLPLNLTPP